MTFIKKELQIKVFHVDKNVSLEQLDYIAECLSEHTICPVFQVSNITGEGI